MDNIVQSKVDSSPLGDDGKLRSEPGHPQVAAADNTVNQSLSPNFDTVESLPGQTVVFEDLATALSTATGRYSKSRLDPNAPKRPLDATGSIIGSYEILSVLGRGGMGIVYKARHRTLKRTVAMKMIQTGLQPGSDAIRRFLTEAQAVAALQHPGIVQIFEIGEHQGLPYFCLEYVEGEDLLNALKDRPWASKPAAELVAALCDAMQYAHDSGVLHGDIKPANILLDLEKRAKISDFGVARRLDASDKVVRDGAVVGTPSYMPPEQARGDTAAMSPRSDVYSLGAVLYQTITGRAPFVSDSTEETLEQVLHRDPIQPRDLQPGVPIDLESICLKALQKEPSNRYQSCGDLATDLRRFLAGKATLARPVGRLEHLSRWSRRNPGTAWTAALASFFVVATAVVSLVAWRITAQQSLIIADERDEAKVQRYEADKQRVIANQQKALAEENAELATKQSNLALENLQFVVKELDGKLSKQPGTSEIRIAIMKSLSKKWDELDLGMVGGVRGQAIPTLMAIRHQIALAFTQLDRIKEADQEFTKVEEMGRERIVLKEGIDSSRLNLAIILMTASQIQSRIGNAQRTEPKLVEARDIVLGIIKQPKAGDKPTDFNKVQQVLGAIHQNLGAEYMQQGRVADSAVAFAESRELNRAVLEAIESKKASAATDASKREIQISELKCAIDKATLGLAYALLRLGKTDNAILEYEGSIASRRDELSKHPEVFANKSELGLHLSLYGRSLLWINKLDTAESILNESVKICDESLQSDSTKADSKRALAQSLYGLGILKDIQGKADQALGYFERSRGLRGDLYGASPDEKNGIDLIRSEARVGNTKMVQELSDKFVHSTSPNPDAHLDRACAFSQASRFLEGDEKASFLNDALTALERSVAEGYMDPFRISKELDLVPLHNEPRFSVIVQKLETMQAGPK